MDVPLTTVDWRSKGFWLPEGERPASWYSDVKPGLFDGGFTWPVMVLRQSAALDNIEVMASYCRRHGILFAPHAKTTMAPGLIAAQFSAGAWGMTVATPNQALVLYRLGVRRVFIANEVLDPVALEWLATVPDFEVYIQVDSLAGVAAAAAVPAGSLRVFVELGHAGGRTGVRSVDALSSVAAAVHSAPRLSLAGVTGYEGQLPDEPSVDAFLDMLAAGVKRLDSEGVLPGSPLVSAGGSAWFDRVVARLGEFELLLRSGASVTHDDGFYRERTPFLRIPAEGPLTAALEIWAQVLSTPEPGLAIVGMGKRDAPFDEGLPVVSEVRPALTDISEMSVSKMNDHHTYVAFGSSPLHPADLVRFGISHPCTAFDKWRDIPVVDDQHRVVDVLHTYF